MPGRATFSELSSRILWVPPMPCGHFSSLTALRRTDHGTPGERLGAPSRRRPPDAGRRRGALPPPHESAGRLRPVGRPAALGRRPARGLSSAVRNRRPAAPRAVRATTGSPVPDGASPSEGGGPHASGRRPGGLVKGRPARAHAHPRRPIRTPSRTCSAHRLLDGPKPVHVRSWTCAVCGIAHDRNVDAAHTALAAGRAEGPDACGGSVRPAARCGAGPEGTGSRRGAARAARAASPARQGRGARVIGSP